MARYRFGINHGQVISGRLSVILLDARFPSSTYQVGIAKLR
jgi:hypothetical protein